MIEALAARAARRRGRRRAGLRLLRRRLALDAQLQHVLAGRLRLPGHAAALLAQGLVWALVIGAGRRPPPRHPRRPPPRHRRPPHRLTPKRRRRRASWRRSARGRCLPARPEPARHRGIARNALIGGAQSRRAARGAGRQGLLRFRWLRSCNATRRTRLRPSLGAPDSLSRNRRGPCRPAPRAARRHRATGRRERASAGGRDPRRSARESRLAGRCPSARSRRRARRGSPRQLPRTHPRRSPARAPRGPGPG